LFSEVNDGLRALALGLSLVAVLAGCQKNNSNPVDLGPTPAATGGRLIVGYYPSWNRYSFPCTSIEYGNLTYIVHAFIFPFADGTLDYSGFSLYPELIVAAHQHGVKVVISVGGWDNVRTPRFSQMTADDSSRARFVRNLRDFCVQNGYDGADIDWEYPGVADRASWKKLFQELKEVFSSVIPALTISMAAQSSDWNNVYDTSVLVNLLDWIGVMTYDFHGSWTAHSGHNSPLYAPANEPEGSASQCIQSYLSRGVPASKLCLGVSFYGYNFTTTGLYQPRTGAVPSVPYSSAVTYLASGWTYHWDSLACVPYLTDASNTHLISYDDTVSMRVKSEYLKSLGLGGVIIWALGQDNTGSSQLLLETLGRELLSPTAEQEEVAPPLPETGGLLPNYPNLFNSQTVIRYVVPSGRSQAHVALSIHDAVGRTVATLVDEWQHRGTYAVHFDPSLAGRALPSGVYYSRLSLDGYTTACSMTYIK